MTQQAPKPATAHSFTAAFERMCNFVAIAQTTSVVETFKQLVLQCFIVLPDDRFIGATDLATAIDVLFGLRVADLDVQRAIDDLVNAGDLQRPTGTNLRLEPALRAKLQVRLDEANQLEDRVRNGWVEELEVAFPDLPPNTLWPTLRAYLAKSFRRHGLQTVAYLDPSIDLSEEQTASLSTLLQEAVRETFQATESLQAEATNAVSAFMATVGRYPDRIAYIAQLADGAFNYYSLTVDPQVATQFRDNLQPLTLFLDTNFLFGILDLHVNPFVDVSNQILTAVRDHRLPFTLRYHIATDEEFRSALDYYGGLLRARIWQPIISRAASKSRNLSGIEMKYHQRNAENPVDADSFLRPYEHFDVILKDRYNILVYRSSTNSRLQAKADLTHEYNMFLQDRKDRKRNKPQSLIDHDIKVLDAVQEHRERSGTSIQAAALLLTCDHVLYKFDWELSKKQHRRSYALLPNLFMQTLRPFLPSSADFDRSFAETFAIPEFRIIGSGATKAASRLVGLLASYSDLPEQTAVSLLSNDLLLDQLRVIEDDKQFQETVEAEIVNQNNALLEEKAELEWQLERERQERLRHQNEVEAHLRAAEATIAEEKQQKQVALEDAERERQAKQAAMAEIAKEKAARGVVELDTKLEQEKRLKAERTLTQTINVVSIVASIALGVSVFLLLNSNPPGFLAGNKQHLPLQIFTSLALALILLGIVRPKWRTACWGAGLFTVVVATIQLLGN
ncbi:MAG: hypothetical protein ACYDBJ_18615 [Aggregatilineales bacterium]